MSKFTKLENQIEAARRELSTALRHEDEGRARKAGRVLRTLQAKRR